MRYRDRTDAATQLAARLARFRGSRPLVLAIPRGAVSMGAIVAKALDGELDVVLTRKIGAPGNPEFAIGAVGESGRTVIDDSAGWSGASDTYIAAAVRDARALMARRRTAWTAGRHAIDPRDRIVIVVDDGLATGATMAVALHEVRDKRPRQLICAVPVASLESLERVTPLADEVVCLARPPGFRAVGEYYEDFPQVTDDEVLGLLRAECP